MGTESFYGEIPEKTNVGAYGGASGVTIWDLCHTTINGMKIWIMGFRTQQC